MHKAAAELGCKMAMLALEWPNSCLGCTGRLRKHCSHLAVASFLARRVVLALNGSTNCLLKALTIANLLMSWHG